MCTFGLAIGLGMEGRGQADLGAEQRAELDPPGGRECGATVRDNVGWDAVEAEDVVAEQDGETAGIVVLIAGDNVTGVAQTEWDD